MELVLVEAVVVSDAVDWTGDSYRDGGDGGDAGCSDGGDGGGDGYRDGGDGGGDGGGGGDGCVVGVLLSLNLLLWHNTSSTFPGNQDFEHEDCT